MQSVVFTNEDARLFCPVSGARLDASGQIDSPALAFMFIDEVGEFSFIRDDLKPIWNELMSEDDDLVTQLEQFENSLPDNIVCFKINDGIAGGYVRVAFDMAYEPSKVQ